MGTLDSEISKPDLLCANSVQVFTGGCFRCVSVRLRHTSTKLRTLRSVETLSTWLYVTTRRECWKVAKKKSREVQLEEWDEAFAEPEGEQLILQHRIRQALDLVSEKCQQLLNALYFADPPMSYDEVSKHFAIPFGSIGPTRARCLEKLRKLLGKKG